MDRPTGAGIVRIQGGKGRGTPARLALGGALVWCAALLLGPVLRRGLDLLATHPETYAIGAWGFLMRLGYLGAATAGGAVAFLARRFPVPAVLMALFAAGAFALGLLPPTGGDTFADQVFPSLQYTPLAFFPAVVGISWRTRRRSLVVLTVLAVVLFVPLVLGEPPHGGLVNRLADLAMGAWLATFALTDRDAGPETDAAVGR